MSSVAGILGCVRQLEDRQRRVGAVEQQERLVAFAAQIDGPCRVDVERPPSDVDDGLGVECGARCGEDAVHGQRILPARMGASSRPIRGPRARASRPDTRPPARSPPQEPIPHMISTGELRKGVTIELDGELWQILDYHHIKMGRGSAQVRITLRNVKRGQTIERSFQAGTKWPRAQLEQRPVQFLYRDADEFHFMDTDTYDQFVLGTDQLGEATRFLKDGMTLDRTSYQGETIGVELPVSVDLSVIETEPGFAGDTQTGARKPATTETGLVVQVPIFVETGDTIRIDTRTGEYQTRV